MIDGFVIKGDVLDQAPLAPALPPVKRSVLEKHYLAISVSVIVHILLGLILFFVAEEQAPKQVENPQPAIKSYLYQRPAKPKIIETTVEVPTTDLVPEKVIVKDVALKKDAVPKEEIKVVAKKVEQPKNVQQPTQEQAASTVTQSKPSTHKNQQKNFSSYNQLKNLRNSINKKVIEQEISNFQQFRSASAMHGDQIPVPHSTIELTPEQEKEQNTTQMSESISMTKHDNGICTIERKQFLGSPVEGTRAAFACGESKFDKNFREHMKKVRDKVMPKR